MGVLGGVNRQGVCCFFPLLPPLLSPQFKVLGPADGANPKPGWVYLGV